MNKICKLCNQDCSSKARYKDEAGQYTCKECYDEFSLDKEKNKEMVTAGSTSLRRPPSPTAKSGSKNASTGKYLQVFGIGLLGVGIQLGAVLSESVLLLVLTFLYILLCNLAIADRLGADNSIFQLIPIVNLFHLCVCVDLPVWTGFLFFVPLVNIVFVAYVYCRAANQLGKPTLSGVLILIPLFNTFLLGYLVSSESLKR